MRHCGHGYGKLFVGIFVLAVGVSWLGHDLGWWTFNIPWIPLAVAIIGIAMILGWEKRERR